MSEAVLDVAVLDASASAVEAEIPAIETPAESPAEETPVEVGTEVAKAEDGKPAEKAETDAASAPITPKVINSQLQELAKTNKPLAAAIHSHVKQGLESQRFLKEVGAKDFAEAKTLLSKPDEATEEFRQSVETSDELLYRGDLKELTNNILEDITSELGEKEGPARLSELSENILEKLKTADPDGHTRITRGAFLAASDTSGLINSLNKLSGYIVAGDTKSAANLLKSIGHFFSEEIAANENVLKTRTEAKAAAEKETTATVTRLKAETETSVDRSMNQLLGGQLSPFLKNQLKGVSRPELESLAAQIRIEAKLALGRDTTYVAEVTKLYKGMRTPAQKEKLMSRFEAALKKDDFGKKLVERVCKEKYPEKFKAPAPKPAAPATTQITIGGKSQTVFQLGKRPTNLVRTDTEIAGRVYTSKELQLLQLSKGIGLVPNKSGKGHAFVQWKR